MRVNSKKIFIFIVWMLIGHWGIAQTISTYSPKVYIPYNINGRWGYSDTLGNILLTPKYDSVSFFEVWHNTHAVIKSNGKSGIIDKNFDLIVKNKYKYLKGTNCCPKEDVNFFSIGNGKKWGVRSTSGKQVIPIKYDDIDFNFLTLGFIAVEKDKKFALFSLTGDRITDFKFNSFVPGVFGGGSYKDLLGESDDGYFLIKEDKTVIPAPEVPNAFKVDLSDPNTRDTKKLPEDQKAKYLNRSLDIKKNYDLDSVYLERPLNRSPLKGDFLYVLVEKEGKKGIWDLKRNSVNFIDYDDIITIRTYNKQISERYGFSELWYVRKNGKWGIVSEKGVIQTPFEYDGFGKITDTFAETKSGGKSGAVIFFTHYPAIPCKYDSIEFHQQLEVTEKWAFGIYKITHNGNTGYVGENGIAFFKFNK